MATAREVKRRMKSVKNIGQVTRALEAVSASKVRRATQAVVASRSYTDKAYEILTSLAGSATTGMSLHPLLDSHKTERKNVTIILITGDRGLAGAYNSNVIRVARRFALEVGVPVRWVAVGRKGRDIILRMKGDLIAEFTNLPARPKVGDISPIVQLAMDDYQKGATDEVYIAYTDFINSLTQKPRVLRLLPLSEETNDQFMQADYIKKVAAPASTGSNLSYEYEPSAAAILDEIVPKFVQMIMLQSFLEAQASEHSSRMVAMRNASDSAKDLVSALQLQYNKARQMGITSEILDIVGGAEALVAD